MGNQERLDGGTWGLARFLGMVTSRVEREKGAIVGRFAYGVDAWHSIT